jgi:hypothetical protein
LVERQFCKLDVAGSIPAAGTTSTSSTFLAPKNAPADLADGHAPSSVSSPMTGRLQQARLSVESRGRVWPQATGQPRMLRAFSDSCEPRHEQRREHERDNGPQRKPFVKWWK